MSALRISIVVATVILAGCAGPMAGLFPPGVGEPVETVFVVNHGWHTGIVVDYRKLPDAARPQWRDMGLVKYLEIGWGDDGFYRAEKVNSGMALRAMFWCNPTVLHVVAMDKEPETYFDESGIVRVTVSTNGFARLCDYLAASYAAGTNGYHVDRGKGIYGNSRFFQATGHYYFLNTCNKWTARALRSTGAPITTWDALRAQNVFDQTREFGTMIRESGE